MMMTMNVLVRLFLARTIQSVGHGIRDLAKGHGIFQLDSERVWAVYFTDLLPTDSTSDMQKQGSFSTSRARYPGSAFGFAARLSDLIYLCWSESHSRDGPCLG